MGVGGKGRTGREVGVLAGAEHGGEGKGRLVSGRGRLVSGTVNVIDPSLWARAA
ncbi:hypothetical protein E1B28_003354 [Marasmius oreades]|uniref:Uncharacterized protein n=1 Tax=Marasmius oreades TaxID=181124 RepID=A0A9P7UMB8_9AGAR|nr:uncharacterized protein E1B28_003354 [Marasmius oreades]KAG7085816.1 hypothetical protein E1B28_003354 [Marasmius oreades]